MEEGFCKSNVFMTRREEEQGFHKRMKIDKNQIVSLAPR